MTYEEQKEGAYREYLFDMEDTSQNIRYTSTHGDSGEVTLE